MPKPTEVLRKKFPRVRSVQKDGVTRFVVDARRKGFPRSGLYWRSTKEDALNLAKEIGDGLTGGNALSDEERSLFLRYRDGFASIGLNIEEVLDRTFNRLRNKTEREEFERVFVGDLVDLWLEEKRSGKFKRIRTLTIRQIELTGRILKNNWGHLQIQSLTKATVQEYLVGLPVSYVTKRGYKVRFGGFFNWCIANGHGIRGNPVKHIKFEVEERMPRTIPVEMVERMLTLSQQKRCFRPLIKYLALGYFGGLRPSEIHRLPPSDINTKSGQIFISREITKTKTERFVTINQTLMGFLHAYPEVPSHIPNFQKVFKRFRAELGFAFDGNDGERWEPDGIRHTFGSMWLAKNRDITHLAEEMGNSPEVIRKHYRRAIPADEADRFWSITPLTPGP